jgi:tetratricopeptide (TPR) repeat protein
LRDGLGRARRARLHRRIGEAFETLGRADDSRAAELAHHFLAAAGDGSDPAPGVRYAQVAGAIATARFAYEDGARLYEAALRALDGTGEDADPTRVELLLQLAEAGEAAGERGDARTAAFEAVRVARRAGTPEQFARAVVLTATTRPDPAIAPLFEEALTRLENTTDAVLQVEVQVGLAWQLATTDIERTRALTRQVFPFALERHATRAFRRMLDCEFQYGGREPEEKLALARTVVDAARAAGDDLAVLYSINHLGVAHLECGDPEAAWSLLAEQQEIAHRYQLPVPHASIALRRSGRALLEGYFDEALEQCSEVLRLCGDDPAFRPICGAMLIAILSELGREHEMLSTIESERSMTHHHSVGVTRAWMYATQGRPADARAELAPLLAGGLTTFPPDLLWLLCMVNLARTAERLGDRELARELTTVLRPFEHRPVVFGYGAVILGVVGHFLGPIVAWVDDLDEGIAMVERAIEVHRSWRARPLVARGEAGLANLLAARGRDDDATRIAVLRASAEAGFAELGIAGEVWTRVYGSWRAGDVPDALLPGAPVE